MIKCDKRGSGGFKGMRIGSRSISIPKASVPICFTLQEGLRYHIRNQASDQASASQLRRCQAPHQGAARSRKCLIDARCGLCLASPHNGARQNHKVLDDRLDNFDRRYVPCAAVQPDGTRQRNQENSNRKSAHLAGTIERKNQGKQPPRLASQCDFGVPLCIDPPAIRSTGMGYPSIASTCTVSPD